MKKILLVLVLLSVAATAFAQDALELIRQDLKTQKVAIMTASLPLTQKQADAFWPIYREYSNDLAKLGDRRMSVLKSFAANYDSIGEKKADELVKESLSIQNDKNSLLEKTYKKVAKVAGGITAARWLQVENQMLTLIDAQIVSQVPLVKMPKSASGEPAEQK